MWERRPCSSASPGRQDPNESTPTVGGTLPARQSEPVPLAILSVQVLQQLHVILGTETGADPKHSFTRLRQAMAGREAQSLRYSLTSRRGDDRIGWRVARGSCLLPGCERQKS